MLGFFITLEGVEGSGKTTIARELITKLIDDGFEVLYTREPGGNVIAESIRNVILDRKHTDMEGRCEALLYAAARRQHLIDVINPALANGKVVICDRFIDSSVAYQGYGREIGADIVWDINKFAIEGMLPSLTVFLDLDPEIGLARIAKDDKREVNRLDLEHLNFHQKVYKGYMAQIKKHPERIKAINANRDVKAVVTSVYDLVKAELTKI